MCVRCYHCCCCKNLAGLFTTKLYTLKMCESNGLTFRFTPPLHFAAAAFLLIQHFFLFTRISSTENIHKNHSHFIIISKMLITHFSSSSSSSVYSGYMIAWEKRWRKKAKQVQIEIFFFFNLFSLFFVSRNSTYVIINRFRWARCVQFFVVEKSIFLFLSFHENTIWLGTFRVYPSSNRTPKPKIIRFGFSMA